MKALFVELLTVGAILACLLVVGLLFWASTEVLTPKQPEPEPATRPARYQHR